jgi:hypothetical protein
VLYVFLMLDIRIRVLHPDPACKLSVNLYDIDRCCVYSEKLLMMDRNCLKHVEFNSKNKFEKLVHLVGLIIRNYS